jgi:DDE superfamily endonuclease
VLTALLPLHEEIVKVPNSFSPTPSVISEDPRYSHYFQNCIGALDGTHIPIFVPVSEQPAWRNRKGWLSQNVLAMTSLDLKFQFVHAGWEGSAHDALVLRDALARGRLLPPLGKYWLADAGFYNTDFMMIPYSRTRYHLKEWEAAGVMPQTKEELFNLRHAMLRNPIERIFGVLKRRFRILNTCSELSISQQVNVVIVCTALFNFISHRERITEHDSTPEALSQRESLDLPEPVTLPPPASLKQEKEAMKQLREDIAQRMWDDYLAYLRLKRRPLPISVTE